MPTLTSKQETELIEGVYTGVIDTNNLPEYLYLGISTAILKAFNDSFYGKGEKKYTKEAKDFVAQKALHDSAYIFGAGKTFQEVLVLQGLRTKDGNIIPFKEYKKEAAKVTSEFNDVWQKTEEITAKDAGKGAKVFKKAILLGGAIVTYITKRDDRVRPEHKALDGITLPIVHSFWRSYWPPNGWGCRCVARFILDLVNVVLNTARITKVTPKLIKEVEEDVELLFRYNVYLDGMIFNLKQHPYLRVAKRFEVLKKRNFNLTIPNVKG